ncbi:hypothetical protein BYT27DRAFT_7248032 [Phlegmacium glaucopus]|nr:hypothetical protein BYT27DRAFT_7248032 [Phlegmacium glaucopus]
MVTTCGGHMIEHPNKSKLKSCCALSPVLVPQIWIMNTAFVAPLQAALLESITKKIRKPRKESQYTPEEKKVLGKYKEEYRRKINTDERYDLFRQHILVDIFNHWYSKGVVSADISEGEASERIKKLSRWITNNWRSYHTVRKIAATAWKKSQIDIVWREMEDKVVEVVNAMVAEDGRTEPATQDEIFKYRTAAARKVLDNLSADKKALIDKKRETGNDPVPSDMQDKRALRMASQAIAKSARKHWKDMGVLTLSFYGYTRPNGTIVVEM